MRLKNKYIIAVKGMKADNGVIVKPYEWVKCPDKKPIQANGFHVFTSPNQLVFGPCEFYWCEGRGEQRIGANSAYFSQIQVTRKLSPIELEFFTEHLTSYMKIVDQIQEEYDFPIVIGGSLGLQLLGIIPKRDLKDIDLLFWGTPPASFIQKDTGIYNEYRWTIDTLSDEEIALVIYRGDREVQRIVDTPNMITANLEAEINPELIHLAQSDPYNRSFRLSKPYKVQHNGRTYTTKVDVLRAKAQYKACYEVYFRNKKYLVGDFRGLLDARFSYGLNYAHLDETIKLYEKRKEIVEDLHPLLTRNPFVKDTEGDDLPF